MYAQLNAHLLTQVHALYGSVYASNTYAQGLITALNYYHATQVTEFLRYQSVCILFIKRLLGSSYMCEYCIYLPLTVR